MFISRISRKTNIVPALFRHFSYLKEHDSITRREIEELLNVKERRARNIANSLIAKEIIKTEGNTNNLLYKLK